MPANYKQQTKWAEYVCKCGFFFLAPNTTKNPETLACPVCVQTLYEPETSVTYLNDDNIKLCEVKQPLSFYCRCAHGKNLHREGRHRCNGWGISEYCDCVFFVDINET